MIPSSGVRGREYAVAGLYLLLPNTALTPCSKSP